MFKSKSFEASSIDSLTEKMAKFLKEVETTQFSHTILPNPKDSTNHYIGNVIYITNKQ
jgi:hypothetical protein